MARRSSKRRGSRSSRITTRTVIPVSLLRLPRCRLRDRMRRRLPATRRPAGVSSSAGPMTPARKTGARSRFSPPSCGEPIAEADLKGPMALYREGLSEGDFDAGIGRALSAVLVSPEFLFRVELDPDRVAPGAAYRISDLELASRLSFFLWSS